MAEIVNLRQARKQKARAAKDKQAEANRTTFGLAMSKESKAEKARARAEKSAESRRLDQAKLDE